MPQGLTLSTTDRVDDRTTLFTFRSQAADQAVKARVIVPRDYDAHPDSRFPVLLNLHGTGGQATSHAPASWQKVLGESPFIFVEPDGGAKGFYTDWWGSPDAARPAPGWETFHLRELLPWIAAHYRTTKGRAVSGGSMGGFGAMSYAARNPGLFQAAAASSGVLDTELLYPVGSAAIAQIYDPCIWGDPVEQRDVWEAHNPTRLAAKLKGVALFVAVGNGLPGRHDTTVPDPQAPVLEVVTNLMTRSFVAALDAARVPVTAWFYGNGTHPWTGYTTLNYDYDNMRRFLPLALQRTGGEDGSCAATTSRPRRHGLDRVVLGRTRKQVRAAYPTVTRRGRFDRFCLHDGHAVRVAYDKRRRATLVLSSSPAHSVRGIHPGDPMRAIKMRGSASVFRVGKDGRVREVGLRASAR